MRTKTLLLTAALCAAGVASSMAQVYSVNVVGYVNQVYPAVGSSPAKLSLVAPPLIASNMTFNGVFGALANFSSVSTWNGTGYSSVTKSGGSFTPNNPVALGTGYFVRSLTLVTNTWVGEVQQGTYTNLVQAGKWTYGDTVPMVDTLTNMGLAQVLPNFSSISKWVNNTNFQSTTKSGGNFTPQPVINIAEGFFINKFGAGNTNYVRTFTVGP